MSALAESLRPEFEKSGLPPVGAAALAAFHPRSEFDSYASAVAEGRCHRVTYPSDGLQVVGFTLRPAGQAVPRPAILYARGGYREGAKIDARRLVWLQTLADAGYTVVGTQFRGNDGGEGREDMGGADVADLLALARLAAGLPDVDGTRLFAVGESFGAMKVALAAEQGLPVRGIALRGVVADLGDHLRRRPDLTKQFLEAAPAAATDWDGEVRRRSVLGSADQLRVPVLMLHAHQDWRVSPAGAEALDARLTEAGTPHRLVMVDPDEHQLMLHRRELRQEILAWFQKYGG
jgi:dipeptidyl aminopeptidase/acylaminoacyl peptidase